MRTYNDGLSTHYKNDRKGRIELIKMVGEGTMISRRFDDDDPLVMLFLSDTAVITVVNVRTGKIITRYLATPGQVKRFEISNEQIKNEVIAVAREYKKKRYYGIK